MKEKDVVGSGRGLFAGRDWGNYQNLLLG